MLDRKQEPLYEGQLVADCLLYHDRDLDSRELGLPATYSPDRATQNVSITVSCKSSVHAMHNLPVPHSRSPILNGISPVSHGAPKEGHRHTVEGYIYAR